MDPRRRPDRSSGSSADLLARALDPGGEHLSASTTRPSRPGFQITRESLDVELQKEVDGQRVTVPALTALDLVAESGGEGIDRVLRLHLASLDDMTEALRLTPKRPGNTKRRQLLLDSRAEPWSEAEREGHRLLREAGITGWRGNVAVVCGEALYFLDIGFEALKLGIEIDGREVHKAENREDFIRDSSRISSRPRSRRGPVGVAAAWRRPEPSGRNRRASSPGRR